MTTEDLGQDASKPERAAGEKTPPGRIAELQKAAKDAAEIAESVPDRYKASCFEVLLPYLISYGAQSPSSTANVQTLSIPTPTKPEIKLQVKALLQQYSIPEDIIVKNFFVEGHILPTYRVEETSPGRFQLSMALLTALESALKTGVFEFSVEDIRQKCKDSGIYDKDNFKNTFKNNKKFFTNMTDEEHTQLSTDGKTELADILLALKK